MPTLLCEGRIWHRKESVRCRNLVDPGRFRHCAITRTGWTLIQVYYIVLFMPNPLEGFVHMCVKPGHDSTHDTSKSSFFLTSQYLHVRDNSKWYSRPHSAHAAGQAKLIGGFTWAHEITLSVDRLSTVSLTKAGFFVQLGY